MSDTQHAPAGWYDDGQSPGRQRYWDGARWTDAYRPAGAVVTPPPARRISNGNAIGIGIVGAVVIVAILIAVVVSTSQGIRPTVTANSGTTSPSASEPVQEPTTESPATQGTVANPYPSGTTLDVSGAITGQLSFTNLNLAANEAVSAANQFNDVPASGMQWAILTVNVKNTGTSPVRPGDLIYSINLASLDGQIYGQKFAALDNLLGSAPDAAPGASVSGDIAYQVPVGTTSVLINAAESFVLAQ